MIAGLKAQNWEIQKPMQPLLFTLRILVNAALKSVDEKDLQQYKCIIILICHNTAKTSEKMGTTQMLR